MSDQLSITTSIKEEIRVRDARVYTGLLAFLLGVLVASLFHLAPLISILFLLIAGVTHFAERRVIVTIALVAFALGILRFDIKDFHEILPAENHGTVVSEPEHRETDTRFVVKTDNGE